MRNKNVKKLSFAVVAGAALLLAACGTSGSETTAVSTTAQEAEEAELPDGVVETAAGLVQGTDEDGIYRYLGIPYAEAKERFVPAEEVEPWDEVYVADSFGPMSPQGSIYGLGAASDQDGTDNNCQNLNIWTPGINDGG